MIRMTIPYPKSKAGMTAFCKRFSLNAYYAGKHWRRRKEDADYWHETVRVALMAQRVPKMPAVQPVAITFWWNDGMDCSNHAAIGKMIEDALKGWVIKDDNRKHVQGIFHQFHSEDYILVEVTAI